MSFGFGNNPTTTNNNNNTFGGFGASNNTGAFGSNNASTSGSLFGGNTATSGGFTGFGASNNNNSPFGASKPTFGATAMSNGGSLFGNTGSTLAAPGGGGGFGTGGSTTAFGSNTGGLFGQNKSAPSGFGTSSTGGTLFGGGASTSAFGSSNSAPANNPFSANTNNAFGGAANTNTSGGFTFGGSAITSTNTNANNNSGTANTPFSAFSEKEGTNNQTSLYQSITFQQPYQNKSFEELRTEDYAQGRRFGNSNGQAGSFGQSTGFGGFGASSASNSGGLFGTNANSTGNTAFGGNGTNNAAANSFGGFGTSNAGSLFGNKNTGGSLFGQQSSGTASGGFGSTAGGGGGLFGNNNNANANASTSVFGNNNNTNNATSLFGSNNNNNNNNNNQQSKPAFGGFGASNNAGSFGNAANAGTSLFGSNANSATNTGGALFGQSNQQQGNPFGSTNNNAGTSLFGNANKPAGGALFGNNSNNTTSGGLFGAQTNQQQNNPFGQSTNTGGSLFGNLNQNQNKPASTSLFGNTASTGGSVFGSQNNQNTGGSLFGNNTNAGGSLFGNNNKPAGSSLFGANNTSGTGSGLFGGTQANQQNNTGTFGGLSQNQQAPNTTSLFGGSLTQSQPLQNQLHASLTGSPYGNEQLFSSLAAPSPPVGPLATPLSGARPAPRKTPSLLASARVSTPVYTPRGGSFGRNGGYGFTYSTYGTPSSAYTSGSLTPGASSLLKPTGSLSSALTSRLNKSLSTSNLRGDSISSEGRSLIRPGAFSAEGTPGRYNSGNVRKLKIDRSLRNDLFGPEPKAIEAAKETDSHALKKTVSFDSSSEKDTATSEATPANALVRTESAEAIELSDPPRARPSNASPNDKAVPTEQIDNTLTTVAEDAEAMRSSSTSGAKALTANTTSRSEIGNYWTKPALKDLKNMSRQQLKNVGNFVVGRDGIGRIEFGKVDLTNTPLEDICGNVVQLNPRSATVYQDDSNKPAMGKALNVPSTIYLENSWPRSAGLKSGKEYDKHIARLKRVAGTHFVKYDPDTGVWCFKVDHFTTYGLDDDDDYDESELPNDSQMIDASGSLSGAPETPVQPQDSICQSMATNTGEMEDTFQFKLDRRSQLSVPGDFEPDADAYVDRDDDPVGSIGKEDHVMSGGLGEMAMDDPFLSSGGPVQAPSPSVFHRYYSSAIEEQPAGGKGLELPGSFADELNDRRRAQSPVAVSSTYASPQKFATAGWEEQLNRTLSPRKRDRQVLKDLQQIVARPTADNVVESPFKGSVLDEFTFGQSHLAERIVKRARGTASVAFSKDVGKSQGFQTAMDLMDSMYSADRAENKIPAGLKSFEV